MATSQPWYCTNPDCQSAGILERLAPAEGPAPRCGCGALMKKHYSPPLFHYLDFLRTDAPPMIETAVRERRGE